jgi:hypothetical protein
MTTAVAGNVLVTERHRVTAPAIAPALAFASFMSLGAGAIHAAAIGVHSEHRQAVVAFAALALLQLAWGVLALQRPGRLIALAGAAVNLAALVFFVVAKTSGIGFVDGLEETERVQLADGTAAAFAAIAVVGAVLAATVWRRPASWFGTVAFGATALATVVTTMFAMVAAGSHAHANGAAHEAATGTNGTPSETPHGHDDPSGTPKTVAVPPKPYDPKEPIDLSGVEGVTPEQQAQAENMIAVTLLRLPKYSDYSVAEADGFRSIGDGFTGTEHFINQAYFTDGRVLDPDYPESLVYDVDRGTGKRTLAAAMYMLETGQGFEDVPKLGGKLMQWHIHNNLCFTAEGRVAGLTNADGSCPSGLFKGPETPMIHVWIRPHPCGPFAALEGVGGGQIAEGETRWCDHAHGDPTASGG